MILLPKIEDIFSMPIWGQLEFDTVRPRLYFSESQADKRSNRTHHRIVMMEKRHGDTHVVPLTSGPHDVRPIPSPDGEWLMFLSRRSGSSQVWRLPLNGGEPSQVTFLQGGVKDFAFAPDSSGLVVVAHVTASRLEKEQALAEPAVDAPDEAWNTYYNRDVKHIHHAYYKLDGEGFFDQGRDQLVWVSPGDSNSEPVLLTNGEDMYSSPVFSADGQFLFCLQRVYQPNDSHPSITRVRRLNWSTREWTTLALPNWSIHDLQPSPDGQWLAFCASKPEEHGYGLTSLYQWSIANETWTDLSSATDRPVGDESGSDVPASSSARPVWRNGRLLMLLSDEGKVVLTEFDTRGDDKPQRHWEGRQVVYDFAVRGDEVALAISDPTHPSCIAWRTFGDEDGPVTFAPTPWDDGKDNAPTNPQEIWATESDGSKVHTWCMQPTTPGPHPTVLEIHGGPMSMYGYRYFHEFQCLVNAGYAVVYTNPRGSQGYGKSFGDAIVGKWGDKDYRDVMAGLEAALHAWPALDADRLAVAGGSYGGFMVNWIISHDQRFKAAITMRSVVNRFSAMGSSDMGWLRVPQYGTKPWWEEPEPYWQQSPLRYASNIHTPLLIEHQEKDYRLPIEQAEQLFSALKYLGRSVEMVLYPEESHGMSRTGRPWHRVHRLLTNTAFLDRHLKE